MIGIISAMDSEIEFLRNAITDQEKVLLADMPYYVGKIDGVDVVLATCGVGKVNAAVHTQILIDRFRPDVIIHNGVAGALSPDLNIFDVVVGDELVYHDMQDFVVESFDSLKKAYRSDPTLVDIATHAAKTPFVGRIASGDVFVSDEETKRAIAEKTGALCVEMEGAAVAHTAYLSRIPFVVLRVISDGANADPELVFAVFERAAAMNGAKIVREMLPHVQRAISKG